MFMGTYHNSIDTKKRLIVPQKHRDQLAGKCVLTKGMDTCLYIYSMDEWERLVTRMAELPESDPDVRDAIRDLMSNAAECEFDKQGRIIVPQVLIDYAHIQKDLITMGAMNKVEIWAKEVWDSPDDSTRRGTGGYSEALAKYNF